MQANDRQVGGDHYGGGEMQHWDVVHIFELDYFQGQITKYLFRWKKKGGVKDLQKAAHFLEKYIELNTPKEKVKNLTEAQYAEAVRRYQVEGQFGDGRMKLKCKVCNQYLWEYKSQAEAYIKHPETCAALHPDVRAKALQERLGRGVLNPPNPLSNGALATPQAAMPDTSEGLRTPRVNIQNAEDLGSGTLHGGQPSHTRKDDDDTNGRC
jgi:hypothetical protein